jgi:hypothetical protein
MIASAVTIEKYLYLLFDDSSYRVVKTDKVLALVVDCPSGTGILDFQDI